MLVLTASCDDHVRLAVTPESLRELADKIEQTPGYNGGPAIVGTVTVVQVRGNRTRLGFTVGRWLELIRENVVKEHRADICWLTPVNPHVPGNLRPSSCSPQQVSEAD